jgi:cell wall-associated NlpC family hydrolase
MRRFQLAVILALAGAGCASPGGVPRPFPVPGDPAATAFPRPSGTEEVRELVGTALSLRGVPYRDGGADPSGFDCSGFVSYVFGSQGLALPRTVTQQFATGRPVPRDGVDAGDLVFFTTEAPGATHVGVAISPSQFIHAPSSSGNVRIESLNSPYWLSRFVGARRLL